MELPKQNSRSLKVWSSKIFVEIRESPAKAARKERESWGAQSKALTLPHELTSNKYNFPFYVLYEVSIAVFGCRNWFMKVSKDKRHLFSQDPKRKLAKARIQVAKRWGKLMAKDHVIRMECARLSFTETWWCIVIHLFSRYSPRKLAKATLLWLLLAKAKTQVAKGSQKIIAKDHVILTKSKRVFYTAQVKSKAKRSAPSRARSVLTRSQLWKRRQPTWMIHEFLAGCPNVPSQEYPSFRSKTKLRWFNTPDWVALFFFGMYSVSIHFGPLKKGANRL